LKTRWQTSGRPVWVAASTHDGEDEMVLDAHRALLEKSPDALLILVPRHPQRFDSVAHLASDGLVTQRMTDATGSRAQVILGDTMGQLIYLYGVAQIAFIGGSLVKHGGHNPIEAAATGLPLIMGPHDFNFTSVVAAFETAGCLHRASDSASLAAVLGELFEDPERRAAEVARAKQVVANNSGATDRIADRLALEISGSLRRRSGSRAVRDRV
jgi:3-deoxy-D-manno-octulosonic-acid transferase